MIVDFQHHFTPRELFKEDLGDRRVLQYDAPGAPSYTSHALRRYPGRFIGAAHVHPLGGPEALRELARCDYPQEIRAREAVRDFVGLLLKNR